jgi:hypothetical protein
VAAAGNKAPQPPTTTAKPLTPATAGHAPVRAMAFVVIARLIYQTLLARMPLGQEGMPYGDRQSG